MRVKRHARYPPPAEQPLQDPLVARAYRDEEEEWLVKGVIA